MRPELGALDVVTGANGSGKSSLYRALCLLADAAQGRVVASLAAEGGLPSALWAAPETVSAATKRGDVRLAGSLRRKPVSLKLGFGGEDYGYAADLGLPVDQARPPGLAVLPRPRDQGRGGLDGTAPQARDRLRTARRSAPAWRPRGGAPRRGRQ